MQAPTKIYNGKKIVAIIVRRRASNLEGINFFTNPKDPLQLAIHKYSKRKKTNVHNNKVKKPFLQSQKQKYVYIIEGSVLIHLKSLNGKFKSQHKLKSGDSIIIGDILHQVVFSKGTKAIEIKQGPYSGE